LSDAMNYPVNIPANVYNLLQSLLNSGVIEQDGKKIDFSPVQNITIRNGVMTFSPPPKVSATVGPVALRTTVSSLTAQAGGIKIEVDNSPVNVEIRPS